jgi:hypothetical protein
VLASLAPRKPRVASDAIPVDCPGKVVVFFQDSGKFKYRYSTLSFQESANLDDGDMWPVCYALQKWSPTVEEKVAEMVAAIS